MKHSTFTSWETECDDKLETFNRFSNDDIQIAELDAAIDCSNVSGIAAVTIGSNREQNSKVLIFGTIFLTIVLATIGIMSAILGAWLILPFAGLEILLLGTCVLIVNAKNRDSDRLAISDKYVHLTRVRRSNRTVNSFIRQWTRVKLQNGKTKHERLRLLVGSHGQYREIGHNLVDSSKRRVHRKLTRWISNDLSSDT